MNLTNEHIEKILDGAPDNEQHVNIPIAGEITHAVHRLDDLREILALRKRIGELEAQVPKWISAEAKLPEYGASVLLKIDGVVQRVTYMRDGSDISADWFEPFHYQDDEATLFISDSVDIEWMPLPQPQPPKEQDDEL